VQFMPQEVARGGRTCLGHSFVPSVTGSWAEYVTFVGTREMSMEKEHAGAPSSNAEWTLPTGAVGFDVGSSRDCTGLSISGDGGIAWMTVSEVVSEQEYVDGRLLFKIDGTCDCCGEEGKMFVPNPSCTYTYGGEARLATRYRNVVQDKLYCRACLKGLWVAEELMDERQDP